MPLAIGLLHPDLLEHCLHFVVNLVKQSTVLKIEQSLILTEDTTEMNIAIGAMKRFKPLTTLLASKALILPDMHIVKR